MPRSCPIAIFVVERPNMAFAPSIDKNVSWSCISATNRWILCHHTWNEREVGYAPNIQNSAWSLATKSFGVKRRHERRAFTTRSNITRAEVAYDINPCEFSEQCTIQNLDSKALFRSVTDRLPMCTQRSNACSG